MLEKIKQIVAENLDKNVEELDVNASILDDLGADSIAVMEIVMELETEFGVEVPTEDVLQLKTIQDIANYIEKLS